MQEHLRCRAAIIIAAVTLSGCAAKYVTVTYMSEPKGAYITEAGKMWGRAPVTLNYLNPANAPRQQILPGIYLAKTREELENIVLPGITCNWASGAEIFSGIITANIVQLGTNITYTCARPIDAPDLDKDMSIANQIDSLELQKRQTDAQEGSFVIQGMQYLNSTNPYKK